MRRLRSLMFIVTLALAPGCVITTHSAPVHGGYYGGNRFGYAQPYYGRPRFFQPAPVYRGYYSRPPHYGWGHGRGHGHGHGRGGPRHWR